jgi:hypothetical protein
VGGERLLEQFPDWCIQKCHGDRSAERLWPKQLGCVPDTTLD